MVLKVVNLEKKFKKVVAVDNISFSLDKGEVVVLAGPNGAGKTTTIKCILSLLKKDSGEVYVYDKDVKNREVREKLAYIPESPDLYPLLTVWEHLKFIALAYRVKDWKKKAEELLKIFVIEDKRNTLAKELSKGMKQKLSICMALVHNPEVFLIDEPFIGLDPKGIKDFKDMLKILRDDGKTILVSTHILSSIEELVDEIIIMKKGKLLDKGSKDYLIKKYNFDNNSNLEDIFLKITEE
ncbi:ABC transporter ATP-binding protein [Clostridium frigidicarnis]|uniref:ABC-type multidrug transport system, ATPase component n=1 Tax=Clostridium frigidicarnis TaxID=84698 RepID=A0A1I0YVU1_9CLOT|nr:ABC transporter ATP-binding protein [Clostridium frigidicarnis]SFB17381.1 ABC-type multidrug transport system, ATPase component [Clostridium frigidicarnis]